MKNSDASTMSAESTVMAMNMMCQSNWSMTKPATVGPMAGAKAMTRPKMPMAEPRLSTGKVISSTVMVMGMRMPAPAAWIRRPARITGKLKAKPHMAEPAANSDMETTNRPLVVKRSCR